MWYLIGCGVESFNFYIPCWHEPQVRAKALTYHEHPWNHSMCVQESTKETGVKSRAAHLLAANIAAECLYCISEMTQGRG